ncbi:MAG: AAA family ATPase [Halochromatium sp.]|nr:AAA family ATPase [Halochromatium sp.]
MASAPAPASAPNSASDSDTGLETETSHSPGPETETASSPPGLAASAAVVWSQPYQFASLDEPGITAATAWREDGELLVLALDVTLARILTAIHRLQATSAGRGFLFDRDGGVYGPPPSGDNSHESETRPPFSGFYNAEQRLGGATAFEAIAAWRTAGEPEDQPVRFESDGQAWWAGFVPLDLVERRVWVGVAYPSHGPLGLLQQRWSLFAGIALAILALGVGLALLIVRRYSHRLRELPKLSIDPSQPETDLYDLIGRGESAHLEFKSTMRLNLRSGKNDKAIELAWLKGVAAFLNSEGGILLLGVADDGEVLGLAADRFANDDKCQLHFKNLVNQHLGPEAMRNLQLTLFWLEDKQIGAIECAPADDPVYLRQSNSGESFLIRTGPSNSELPISRALGYIKNRF